MVYFLLFSRAFRTGVRAAAGLDCFGAAQAFGAAQKLTFGMGAMFTLRHPHLRQCSNARQGDGVRFVRSAGKIEERRAPVRRTRPD
jgi:hypothetical protein